MNRQTLKSKIGNLRSYLGARKHALMPRNSHVSPPVLQIYVEKEGTETSYTLTNFPSLYSPENATDYIYDLKLFDLNGKLSATSLLKVPPFASVEVYPRKIFKGPLPKLGVFSAGIRSSSAFFYGDRHLGTITPHFYTLYRSANGSIGLVHPQTVFNPGPSIHQAWESNQLILPIGVERIRLLQMNPNALPSEMTLELHSRKRGKIIDSKLSLPALGVREVEWEIGPLQIARDDFLFVASPRLPGPNSKPLLFCIFEGNRFNASHA